MWKGSIIKESLGDSSLLELVDIVETKENKLNIEVKDGMKDEFIQKAIKSINPKFYTYLVKDKVMYVVFKGRMFKFSRGYPEMETAKKVGEELGIARENMPFEKFIEDPFAN